MTSYGILNVATKMARVNPHKDTIYIYIYFSKNIQPFTSTFHLLKLLFFR